MATDPAFVIVILSALRSRIPSGLRAFLITLAVADDIGAIFVIALVYNEGFLLAPILVILALLVLLLLFNRSGVYSLLPYILVGGFLWSAFMASGIHTSVAGIALALTIPVQSKELGHQSPVNRLEHILSPWIRYLILPVFALANAGVSLQGTSLLTLLLTRVGIGVFLGLLFGKPAGIMIASLIAVIVRAAHLPKNVRWRHIAGASFLCGIGFTTSIFLAGLAFPGDARFDQSKLGILSASLIAALIGWLILWKIHQVRKKNSRSE